MKSSRAAVAGVVLALAGLWYAAGGTQPPARAGEPLRVSAPLTHENLAVFFVHGPDAVDDSRVVSLQEALECGWAVVHETGSVNTLAVENCSADRELFVQSGDIIKGGRQDRMIAEDLLLPPGSGRVAFAAHCVEQGRWTGRPGDESTRFKASANCAVGNEIKLANANRDQSGVWKNVAASQEKLSKNLGVQVAAAESRTSLQLALENPAVRAKVGEYEAALRPAGESRPGVVGVVFAVNGRVTGAEVYGSNGLFRKAWPKLLNAAAVEALAERDARSAARPPSPREVERFLASAAKPEAAPAAPAASPENAFSSLANNRFDSWTLGNRVDMPVRGRGANAPAVNQTEGRQTEARQTAGRVIVSGAEVSQDRVILNEVDLRGQNAAPEPVPQRANPATWNEVAPGSGRNRESPRAAQPANTDGNRLSSNRVDNPSALVVESKDPARNAVIHRSYIKK